MQKYVPKIVGKTYGEICSKIVGKTDAGKWKYIPKVVGKNNRCRNRLQKLWEKTRCRNTLQKFLRETTFRTI